MKSFCCLFVLQQQRITFKVFDDFLSFFSSGKTRDKAMDEISEAIFCKAMSQ